MLTIETIKSYFMLKHLLFTKFNTLKLLRIKNIKKE